MDGVVWHKNSYNLPNLTILKLPPYSTELNSIEQIWQYVKQGWLSDSCFNEPFPTCAVSIHSIFSKSLSSNWSSVLLFSAIF